MSTELCNAIKFTSLLKQLSKNEFLQFMDKIYDNYQSDLISISFFNYFIYPPSITDPNANHLNKINCILSDIIQSRKPKPESKSLYSTTNTTLNQLPKALIGYIASFHEQHDYFSFQLTNRSIFLGCNSPNMLLGLDLFHVNNYSLINLQQYRSLKCLAIHLNKFKELKLPQNGEFIMNKLENLQLYGDSMDDIDIKPFMTQNFINIDNIKFLKFEQFGQFGDESNLFNIDKFWRLLTKFKNVEYLQLQHVCLPQVNEQQLQQLHDSYGKLKGLICNKIYEDFLDVVVNLFAERLEFLEAPIYGGSDIDFSSINCSKLQQILLVTPDVKTINHLLKSAKNIKKMCILTCTRVGLINSSSSSELKDIIPQVFKCKLLEYFEISVNNENFVSVLNAIEMGLYETKKYKRKQMKIKIHAATNSNIDLTQSLMLNVENIVNRLEKSNTNDFMFILDMKNINETFRQKMDENKILKELNEISTNTETKANGLCFVITNKNCKICGWNEYWAMHVSN